jgi:beta-mannosidase
MQTQTITGDWQFRECGKGDWLPARVPGSAYTDLLALERIPDPFYGDNEQRARWVAEADWEYRLSFSCSPELLAEDQVFLVCDGLDTLAAVTLNGQEIGRTDNMFRQYRWDVKPLLAAGSNEFRITFSSPVKYAAAKQAERALPGVPQAIPGGPYRHLEGHPPGGVQPGADGGCAHPAGASRWGSGAYSSDHP